MRQIAIGNNGENTVPEVKWTKVISFHYKVMLNSLQSANHSLANSMVIFGVAVLN